MTVDLDTARSAAYAVKYGEEYKNLIHVQWSDKQIGNQYGRLMVVTWRCPACDQKHIDKQWFPDGTAMQTGFDWR